MMCAKIKEQMHKQKGKKYSNKKTLFLIIDKLTYFSFNYSLLEQQVWNFWFTYFFLIFQKIGSVGPWETKHFIGIALPFLFETSDINLLVTETASKIIYKDVQTVYRKVCIY